MRKRVVYIVLVGAVILMISMGIYFGVSDWGKDGRSKIIPKVSEDPELNRINQELILLDKLEQRNSTEVEEKLIELSRNQNAVGYKANLILAEKQIKKGENPAVYYRQALELYESEEISGKLALHYEQQGNHTEAARFYSQMLPDNGALKSLLNLNMEPEDKGKILIEKKQWKSAAEFIKSEIQKSAEKSRILELKKLYAKALGGLGDYKLALAVIESLLAEGEVDRETKLLYGRCLEAVGQIEKAKDIYGSLDEMGAYRLGMILEKEEKLREAAAAFGKSTESQSQWRSARIWDDMGSSDKALELYKLIAGQQGVYQDDAAYRAYVLIKKSKGPGADKMLDIIAKYPAWMKRLNKEPVMENMPDVTYDKPDFLNKVDAYRKIKRYDLAEIELAIGEKNCEFQDKLALGDWYLGQGKYYMALRWGIKALKEQPSRRAYELAYQRPFDEVVVKASKEFGIEPNLLWALMREESYFMPDAVSRVGALGLLQLMPSTAKEIAVRLNITYNEKDLLNPETNIRFGAYYLSKMLKMFSGNIDKALAAYNGGAGNVQRWSKSRIGMTDEGFPTAITFLETREYITKVKNSYYIYRWLYDKD